MTWMPGGKECLLCILLATMAKQKLLKWWSKHQRTPVSTWMLGMTMDVLVIIWLAEPANQKRLNWWSNYRRNSVLTWILENSTHIHKGLLLDIQAWDHTYSWSGSNETLSSFLFGLDCTHIIRRARQCIFAEFFTFLFSPFSFLTFWVNNTKSGTMTNWMRFETERYSEILCHLNLKKCSMNLKTSL